MLWGPCEAFRPYKKKEIERHENQDLSHIYCSIGLCAIINNCKCHRIVYRLTLMPLWELAQKSGLYCKQCWQSRDTWPEKKTAWCLVVILICCWHRPAFLEFYGQIPMFCTWVSSNCKLHEAQSIHQMKLTCGFRKFSLLETIDWKGEMEGKT